MQYRKLYEGSIIVAPRESWDFFYEYRKEYPTAAFSLLTIEDLEAAFSYHFDDRAVIYLLKKGYSLELANDSLKAMASRFLKKGIDEKLDGLYSLQQELVSKGLLFMDAYPEKPFGERNIVIHSYQDGGRISLALEEVKKLSVSFDNVFFKDPGNEPELPELHDFVDIYAEAHYVCNRIAKLIDNGVSPDDIYLAGIEDSYTYLLPLLSASYGFYIEMPSDRRLIEEPIAKEFLESFAKVGLEESLKLIGSLYPDDLNLQSLSLLTQTYYIKEFDVDSQIKLYRELFLGLKSKVVKSSNCVHVLSNFYPPVNSHIFFLGFALNNAPRAFRDSDFLEDKEKEKLYLPTSLLMASTNKSELVSLLYSGHVDCLSFKTRALGMEYFPSPLLLELPFKKAPDNSLPYEYSLSFTKLWTSHLLDGYEKYLKQDPKITYLQLASTPDYGTYNPSFFPFENESLKGQRHLSYSSLTSFYNCQFKYYCDYILRVGDNEPLFSARYGSLFHEVLQNMYQPGFDLDKSWEQGIKDIESKPGNPPFNDLEKILLVRLKDQLQLTIDFLHEHEAHMDNPEFYQEYFFKTSLTPETYLTGSIDKVVLTGENHQYLTIVDYKTGTEKYDDTINEFGLSLQLPIYAYIALNDPHFGKPELIGLFIDQILASSLIKSSGANDDKFINDQLKLQGIYTNDPEKLKTFEPDYHFSAMIKGLKYTDGKGFITASRATIKNKSPQELADLAALAEQKALEADEKIRKGDFQINPKLYSRKVNACQYCSYKDICYMRDYMRVLLKKEGEPSEESEEDSDA